MEGVVPGVRPGVLAAPAAEAVARLVLPGVRAGAGETRMASRVGLAFEAPRELRGERRAGSVSDGFRFLATPADHKSRTSSYKVFTPKGLHDVAHGRERTLGRTG